MKWSCAKRTTNDLLNPPRQTMQELNVTKSSWDTGNCIYDEKKLLSPSQHLYRDRNLFSKGPSDHPICCRMHMQILVTNEEQLSRPSALHVLSKCLIYIYIYIYWQLTPTSYCNYNHHITQHSLVFKSIIRRSMSSSNIATNQNPLTLHCFY